MQADSDHPHPSFCEQHVVQACVTPCLPPRLCLVSACRTQGFQGFREAQAQVPLLLCTVYGGAGIEPGGDRVWRPHSGGTHIRPASSCLD